MYTDHVDSKCFTTFESYPYFRPVVRVEFTLERNYKIYYTKITRKFRLGTHKRKHKYKNTKC